MADTIKSAGETAYVNEKGNNQLEAIRTITHGDVEDINEVGAQMAQAAGAKHTLRHLLPRHIQLMAFSGVIGTGLFVGSGAALARAGLLGLFLGYSVYALLVRSTFNAVGEMVTWLPIDGSIIVFAHAYLDDAWGFSLGWLYTVTNSLSAAGEAAAVAAIFNFWTLSVNNGVYIAIITTSLVAFNIFGVRIYGEGEFYFSLFKILLILGLLLMTFIVIVGGNPQGDAFGLRYWRNPRPFNE